MDKIQMNVEQAKRELDPRVTISVETARGCGFRKQHGLYMMGGGEGLACGALPIPLHICPTCNQGIKPARGFTWVDLKKLMGNMAVCSADSITHRQCPLGMFMDEGQMDKVGLMWVGSKYYSPKSFLNEARDMGVSKRIPFVPNDFIVGESWLALAHREAIMTPMDDWVGSDPEFTPGVFMLFQPDRIEYIVSGEETEEEIDRIIERGLTPVYVVKAEEKDLQVELI